MMKSTHRELKNVRLALTVMYWDGNVSTSVDVDHVFPHKQFKSLDNDDRINSMAKLQFLTPEANKRKSGRFFNDWVRDEYQSKNDRDKHIELSCIPEDEKLWLFSNYDKFFTAREELIRQRIAEKLKARNVI